MTGLSQAAAEPVSIELELTDCPLCGCEQWKLYRTGRDLQFGVPGVFTIVRCRDCRHVFMNPSPTPASVPDCYPPDYTPHLADEALVSNAGLNNAASAGPWYLSRLARAIPGLRSLYYWLTDTRAEIIPEVDRESMHALEIGCGGGSFLQKLRSQGWQCEAVEPVAAAAQAARKRGFSVHTGTVESARFEKHRFDAVFAWMVVEHLIRPRRTLQEIHCILKPRAWLVFSVPNFGCWEPHVFRKYWLGYDLPRHLQYFSPRTIRYLLRSCSFEPVAIVHQRNILYLIGSTGMWMREQFRGNRMGTKLLKYYFGNPPLWMQLSLAPLAKKLAWIRQAGRLTIIARPL